MIKSSSFTVLLLLISWTQLSGQPGRPNQDTIKCYGLTELQHIAASLVDGQTCDTLYSVAKIKLANRDTLIKEKDFEIGKLNNQLSLKDGIIKEKETTITNLSSDLKTANQHKKWLKFGWGSTTVLLLLLTVFVGFH